MRQQRVRQQRVRQQRVRQEARSFLVTRSPAASLSPADAKQAVR
jgi:hypothetical protein